MEKKKKLKTAKLTKEEDEFWDVESLGGRLVDSSRRRKIYDLNGAQVSLAYLSSEMCTGDTFWVTPLGEGFSDIRKRSPLVNVKELLDGGDPKKLQAAIESLSLEAILLRDLELRGVVPGDDQAYQKLVTERITKLPTVANSYVF